MNKSLIKDTAKSFVDSKRHNRDFMRCAFHPLALSQCHMHAVEFIYTNANAQQILCCQCHRICAWYSRIFGSTFTLQHSRLHIHLHLCSSVHKAALMLQLSQDSIFSPPSCCSIGAIALTQQSIHSTSQASAMIKFFPSKIKPLPTFCSNCLDGISFCPDGVVFCSLGGEVLKTFSVGHCFQLFFTIQGK